MDLPTIGLQTFKDVKKYGLKGLVLKSKKIFFWIKRNVLILLIKIKYLLK